MSQTISIPFLRSGCNYAVKVYDEDLTVVEASLAITEVGSTGVYTASLDETGRLLFDVIDLDNSNARVEDVPRIRTLYDDEATYTILTGLDGDAPAALPIEPTDSEEFATGYLICYDENGERENDVDITIQLTSGPGVAGFALDTKSRTGTSATVEGVVGYVEFTGLRRGATYSITRAAAEEEEEESTTISFANRVAVASTSSSFTVPDSATFAIDEVIGADE